MPRKTRLGGQRKKGRHKKMRSLETRKWERMSRMSNAGDRALQWLRSDA